eukprot:COSAG01_NODE_1281_length_10920_cov_39.473480_6_plen_160_part_00
MTADQQAATGRKSMPAAVTRSQGAVCGSAVNLSLRPQVRNGPAAAAERFRGWPLAGIMLRLNSLPELGQFAPLCGWLRRAALPSRRRRSSRRRRRHPWFTQRGSGLPQRQQLCVVLARPQQSCRHWRCCRQQQDRTMPLPARTTQQLPPSAGVAICNSS